MEWAVYSTVCLASGPGREDVGWGGAKGMVRPFPDQSLWVSSCVCKNDQVGDGHACYGHLLHEVQRANQIGLVLLRLRMAIAMLGVCPLGLPVTMPLPHTHKAGRETLSQQRL